jgi:hypothetical protein
VCYHQSDNTKQMNLSNNLVSLKRNFKHIYVQAYPQCVEIRHTDTTFTAGICHISMRSPYSCRIGRHIFLPAEFNVFALPRVLGVGETGHVIFEIEIKQELMGAFLLKFLILTAMNENHSLKNLIL